jgi:lipopolysaccharide/colanic/teichoic acid biosynthesis glycosyltransferase
MDHGLAGGQGVNEAQHGGSVSRQGTGTSAKRIFDVVLAAAALVVILPLFLALAIAVRLTSRGPVFFRCERIGYRGRPLRMLKFRKMHHNASGPGLTTAGDGRFTRVGAFLARTKLDELPQLWHVLRGDMSLVGPRPESQEFVAAHPDEYELITEVRPGILGLSQLAFASESAILDADDPITHYVQDILPQKVGLDVRYSRQRSFWLDLRILYWGVVAVVFRRPIAVHRQTLKLGRRRRLDPSGRRLAREA